MVKYTKDNITGITFEYQKDKYKIISVNNSHNECHLKGITSTDFDCKDYGTNSLIGYLNSGTYRVISQSPQIYELW